MLILVLAPRGVSSTTPVFPSPKKPTFPKFQFDLGYCQALYHKALAREIVQALLALLINHGFTLLIIARNDGAHEIAFPVYFQKCVKTPA